MAVTDLTGYTWTCSSILCGAGTGIFNINYTYNGEEWSEHPISQQLCIGYKKTNEQGFPLPVAEANSVYMIDMQPTIGYVSIGDYLTFTGGTDVTNTSLISWLEENGTLTPPAPEPVGYEVTFVTNGGTSVTKLENIEELPTPLPTTTKANNIFVGWFYDSGFEEQAFSGDAISSNITLYAKWYANMSDFYQDVADAIRSKNGETNPIKHTDFAYKIKNIQGAKPEETKTVTPDFASGNVVVTPTSGKVMTQVTINKDTTNHIPENIKDGVNILGIIGSYTGSGGQSQIPEVSFSSGTSGPGPEPSRKGFNGIILLTNNNTVPTNDFFTASDVQYDSSAGTCAINNVQGFKIQVGGSPLFMWLFNADGAFNESSRIAGTNDPQTPINAGSQMSLIFINYWNYSFQQ